MIDIIRVGLDEALKTLGEFTRRTTWRRLETEYGISLEASRPLTIEEVQLALQSLFGEGSELLLNLFKRELDRLASGSGM